MKTITLFLASSSELKNDREQLELAIGRKNKLWIQKELSIRLELCEDFPDLMSRSRLQDEYNKAVRQSDIFILLFFTKVGKFTEEEFDAAFGQFSQTGKPFIFTYFKDAPVSTGSLKKEDLLSLLSFKEKLEALGHYFTAYQSPEDLNYQINHQLDLLEANGFLELNKTEMQRIPPYVVNYSKIGDNSNGNIVIQMANGG